tara:strand:+ start:110 stop:499 length:390 start_codon:yes stop_codon:yes gene_type:complete
MRVPGVAVGMVLNVPRISLGPFGLGSQVSRWLIPPHAKRMIHDFARPDELVFLSVFAMLRNFKKSARENPRQPRLVDKTFLLLISGGRKRSLISSTIIYVGTNNNALIGLLINLLSIKSESSEIIKLSR